MIDKRDKRWAKTTYQLHVCKCHFLKDISEVATKGWTGHEQQNSVFFVRAVLHFTADAKCSVEVVIFGFLRLEFGLVFCVIFGLLIDEASVENHQRTGKVFVVLRNIGKAKEI